MRSEERGAASLRESAAIMGELASARSELDAVKHEFAEMRSSITDIVNEEITDQISSFMDEMKRRYPEIDLSWVLRGTK